MIRKSRYKKAFLIFLCLPMIFLMSCQTNYQEEDKPKMDTTAVVETLFNLSQEELEKPASYEDLLQSIQDKYGDYLTDKAIEQSMNNGTFTQFSQAALDLGVEVSVKEIEIKKTSEKNYYFIAALSVLQNDNTSSDYAEGNVQFDDEDKINYINLTKKPKFFDDHVTKMMNSLS